MAQLLSSIQPVQVHSAWSAGGDSRAAASLQSPEQNEHAGPLFKAFLLSSRVSLARLTRSLLWWGFCCSLLHVGAHLVRQTLTGTGPTLRLSLPWGMGGGSSRRWGLGRRMGEHTTPGVGSRQETSPGGAEGPGKQHCIRTDRGPEALERASSSP